MNELTQEEIERLYNQNILNRNQYLSFIISILNNTTEHLSISLDGKWGSGKTVLLKELQYLSENKTDDSQMDEFHNQFCVVYFDAWQHEKYNNPLISMIYELSNIIFEKDPTLNNKFINKTNDLLKSLGFGFIKATIEKHKWLHFSIQKFNEYQKENMLHSEIISIDRQIELIYNYIESLLQIIHKNKLLFIIDELDRCKPDYTISLLEITKHIFIKNNIHCLFGINKIELSNSISHFYGHINAMEYMDKIFNMSFSFPKLSKRQLNNYFDYQELLNKQAQAEDNTQSSILKGYDLITKNIFWSLNLSLREINYISKSLSKITSSVILDNIGTEGHFWIYIFIYLISLKVHDYDNFYQITRSNERSIIVINDFFRTLETNQNLYNHNDFNTFLNKIRSSINKKEYDENACSYNKLMEFVNFYN